MRLTVLSFYIFLLLFSFVGCRTETKNNEELVIALEGAPRRIDPRYATDSYSLKIGELLFDGLFRKDKNSELISAISSSYKQESDLSYLFNISKDIKFHNGKKLTADDIVYTYRSILDKSNSSLHRGRFNMIERVEKVNDYAVRFKLIKPYSPFLGLLTFPIIPEGIDQDAFEKKPIGTGPFKFVKADKGKIYKFRSNEDYFGKRSELEAVTIKIIPDETVRVLELESGKVDIIMNPLTPDLLPRFEKTNKIKIMKTNGTNYSYIGLNLKDPILSDIKVREAIAYAIDKDSIIKYIMKGMAVKTDTLIDKSNRFYTDKVKKFEYNPAKAKKLLDLAGYTLNPRMKLEFSTSQNDLRKRIVEAIQYQLGMVGIEIVIKSYEWGTFFEKIRKGDFQLYSLTWVGVDDPDILYNIFHSKSIPPDGANRNYYINPKLDRLLEKGRIENQGKRFATYENAQKIISDDLPYISLWHSVNIALVDSRVENFILTEDESFRFLSEVRLSHN